jgi:hypothetical protein
MILPQWSTVIFEHSKACQEENVRDPSLDTTASTAFQSHHSTYRKADVDATLSAKTTVNVNFMVFSQNLFIPQKKVNPNNDVL